MSDKTDEIIKLSTGVFEGLGRTMFGEITDAIGKFSLLTEKGTVVFLQSTGAVFIILAVVLTWRSENVFEHLMLTLTERATSQRSLTPPSQDELGVKRPGEVDLESKGAPLKLPAAPLQSDMRPLFGGVQFIALVSGGVVLVLTGSVIDIVAYKWKLETYRQAQALDQESLRLRVALRQSGVQALSESNKEIGNLVDVPGEAPTGVTNGIPDFKPK